MKKTTTYIRERLEMPSNWLEGKSLDDVISKLQEIKSRFPNEDLVFDFIYDYEGIESVNLIYTHTETDEEYRERKEAKERKQYERLRKKFEPQESN